MVLESSCSFDRIEKLRALQEDVKIPWGGCEKPGRVTGNEGLEKDDKDTADFMHCWNC